MELEFDLCDQPSIYSDIFEQHWQEYVWKRILIEEQPLEVLLNIMKFLDLRDIFYVLNRTSREFYTLISKNAQFRANLIKMVFKRSTGFSLPSSSNLSEEKIIKMLLIPSQINNPIAFYGYASNGGFDQLHEYWVDTAFIKGLWSICSKLGIKNVNIAGSTLSDSKNLYSTYLKNFKSIDDMVCSISNYIKLNFNGDAFSFNYIKRIFYGFSLDEFEEVEKMYRISCMNQNQLRANHEQMKGLLKIAIDLYQKTSLSKQMNLSVHQNVIEDTSNTLCNETINILTGVQISREGFFSCPVKTLMLFGSNKRIQVDKNPDLDYFNDINNEFTLEKIVNKKNLQIVDTNIKIFKQSSRYFDSEQTEFKFVVFSNQNDEKEQLDLQDMENEDKEQLQPIAWVQYTAEYIDYICLQFRRMNYFNCKHVAVKLIDSENRIKEKDKYSSTNIDFNYIQFKGMQIKLN
ncbi:hypothetical protein ABPG74_014827 [Tetrahymena malaccensis]